MPVRCVVERPSSRYCTGRLTSRASARCQFPNRPTPRRTTAVRSGRREDTKRRVEREILAADVDLNGCRRTCRCSRRMRGAGRVGSSVELDRPAVRAIVFQLHERLPMFIDADRHARQTLRRSTALADAEFRAHRPTRSSRNVSLSEIRLWTSSLSGMYLIVWGFDATRVGERHQSPSIDSLWIFGCTSVASACRCDRSAAPLSVNAARTLIHRRVAHRTVYFRDVSAEIARRPNRGSRR